MSKEVIIDMRNPNALIAMACVENNSNNPYLVFGEYIKYCLFSNPNVSTTFTQIKESVAVEFGIHIPGEIINYCIQILQTENLVSVNNGVITCIGNYDTNKFEEKKDLFVRVEKDVLRALIDFAAKYHRSWTEEEARENLLQVLDGEGLAYDIFIKDDSKEVTDGRLLKELYLDDEAAFESDIHSNIEQPLFSNRNIVGRFINETMNSNTEMRNYLRKICEGIMICVGAFQIPSNGTENIRPNIKNTVFLFDTKLLLRILGIGSLTTIEAAKELYDVIVKYGGKIRYFNHTLKEMDDALYKAINAVKKNDTVYDADMQAYIKKVGYQIGILEAKKTSLKTELEELNIYAQPNSNFDESDRLNFGFDSEDLKAYMRKWLNDRDPRGVDNDALSIWETHMLRKGNYENYFGTKKCLSVFVTTTKVLCEIALKYRSERDYIKGVQDWKSNRLPVITSMKTMCRLWSPSDSSKDFPLMYLSANAYAAQKPTRQYLNKVREFARRLEKEVPAYGSISLTEYFDDKIVDKIFEKTEAGSKELELEMFVDTLEDVSAERERKQKEYTVIVEKELDKERRENLNHREAIIYDSVNRNRNTMDVGDKLKVHGILLWEWFAVAFFAGLAFLLSTIGPTSNTQSVKLLMLFIVLTLAEKFFTSNAITIWLLKKSYPGVEQSYKMKIIKNLGISDKMYSEEIIKRVLAEDKIIQKCKKKLKEE